MCSGNNILTPSQGAVVPSLLGLSMISHDYVLQMCHAIFILKSFFYKLDGIPKVNIKY